jgi:hypothetical protein
VKKRQRSTRKAKAPSESPKFSQQLRKRKSVETGTELVEVPLAHGPPLQIKLVHSRREAKAALIDEIRSDLETYRRQAAKAGIPRIDQIRGDLDIYQELRAKAARAEESPKNAARDKKLRTAAADAERRKHFESLKLFDVPLPQQAAALRIFDEAKGRKPLSDE